jgi:hypothetical protein
VRWRPEQDECPECGFSWSISTEAAIHLVEHAPDRFASLLANNNGAPPESVGRWSATSYLWHTVDVIRFGTERLWTITLDATSGVPGWDQDALADVRRYDELSVAVGLRALRVAIRDWVKAARDAPDTSRVEHPILGSLTTGDSIRRNAHEIQHHELDIRRVRGP